MYLGCLAPLPSTHLWVCAAAAAWRRDARGAGRRRAGTPLGEEELNEAMGHGVGMKGAAVQEHLRGRRGMR